METAPFLLDIGLALLLAAGFGWVARKLGLPAVVGYLAAGLVVSRFTPGYVADRHQIELLAEVGVVLLLFEVGIEVDLGRLRREHGGLLWASPAQIGVTTLVAAASCSTRSAWRRSAPRSSACRWRCRARSSSSTSPARGGGRRTSRPTRACSAGACSRT